MFSGETLGQPSTYISPRRAYVLPAHTACAYLRWEPGVAVRDRGNVFPQRIPPACAGGEGLCRVHAHHGCLAAYLAIVRNQPNNIGGGILTFYLIGTAWLTARRRDGETSRFDWVALLIPLAIGILMWMNGLKVVRSGASSQNGVPVGMILFMGSVCLLAAAGDVRMLVRGGVFGAKRIARHLWRTCFRLFIAAGSFFFGGSNRPLRLLSTVGLGKHLSPALFNTTLYLVLTILPLILLIFWLIRVRFTNAYKGKSMPLAPTSPD